MPELPEVETTRAGIAPYLVGRRVVAVRVRERRLRWPVPPALERELPGQRLRSVTRRAKYLLIGADAGTLMLHLGMSGSLRLTEADDPPGPHDHLDLVLDDHRCLRLRDPRRFGAALWTPDDPLAHPLLADLGPEPLADGFTGEYLFRASRQRRVAIRDLLLNGRIVAGIGNIYANEALFRAGIAPRRRAGSLTRASCQALAREIRLTLGRAVQAGGTTLRDFRRADGRPGYFRQCLEVYGRAGEPCPRCGNLIRGIRIGSRKGYYCPHCQR